MTPEDIKHIVLVMAALLIGAILTGFLIRHIIIETGRFDQRERELSNPETGETIEL